MTYSLVFQVTGANRFGANTGTLTLKKDGKDLIQSQVFSGGTSPKTLTRFSAIPLGHFRIRTDIRQTVTAYSEAAGDRPDGIHHWYGMEKIDTPAWQWEWGQYRAALNERGHGLPQAYRGNFLHGKHRPDDWTHGCICERSEAILQFLWSLPPQKVNVTVER